jgi:nucleoid DNA-binding protein
MNGIDGYSMQRLNNGTSQSYAVNESDVISIWDALSHYIFDEMNRNNGVTIPGFGTFTFVEQRMDIAQRTQLVRCKPFLVLSEKMIQTHSIKQNIELIKQSVPMNKINYTQICLKTNNKYARDVVETVLREAFTSIQYFLRKDGHVRIDFPHIGTFKLDTSTTRAQDVFDFLPSFTANLSC